MKQFCLCLFFVFIATAAATTARAQAGPAGKTYGGDQGLTTFDDRGPSKLTGVLDKIEKFRNGLRITVKADNKKEYQYNLFYVGQGPQVKLSVEKNVDVQLKTLDDLKLNDTVFLKLDQGTVKALVLKERPADKPKETPEKS